ncbi:hypothetical protein Q7P37_000824 [Cladosporium fusiforme]
MLSSSSSLFTSLPARPPTPPKDVQEHVKNAFDFLENGHEEANKDASDASNSRLSTDTPPVSSPVSSQEVNAVPTTAKKVGFSPFPPTFHEVPQAGISSSPRDRLLRSTPRPRSHKAIKSILKLSSFAPPPTPDEQERRLGYFSPEDPSSFGKMLQSVLNELASSSRTSRLDAYLALHGALTAYDGIPDRQAMATNMPQFQQYISRDMTWRSSGDLTDTQIATQALKLACTMVFDSQLSKAMDDEFRTFLIDRSIAVMEQSDMPKALVKTHLYLVAQQKFPASIITQNRAERMISALRTIEDRCSSNSLIATRLVIYQRLLDQAPVVMSNRLRDWLEHVFHGMLSSVNDTRMRAIEVGNHAGLLLGTNPAASKALHDLFETEVEEGQTYCDYLTLRLTSMIGDKQKQAGAFVPQIWSAVILFFRSKRRPLEKWPRLRNWLQVLQKCLNSSDFAIKNQANIAWKKLVFTVMPDASTTSTMLSMLKVPIVAGFEKRGADRTGKQARQFALDLYHNLLHYSMRPSLSHADLDVTWDAYVSPILSDMIKASQKGRFNACKILHGLLSSNPGVWNELAAMETNSIKSHDLPRLDPRWVRARLTKVLALVEPIMSAELWTSKEEHALAARVWQNTLQSIAEAGTQEVRTSNELREAIALVMNLFQRLWKSPPTSENDRPLITSTNFQDMMRTTCHYIGPSLLAEDILARTPQGNAEAAPTPSHRPSKHQHSLYSPLLFTLSMLCSQPQQGDEPQWRAMAAEILELACKSKATSAAKLQLINRTSHVLQTSSSYADDKEQVSKMWTLFAEQATAALQHSKAESAPTGTLGQKLRDALSIVIYGLPIMHSNAAHADAERLLIEEIASVARSAAGDSGVMLALIEPLSKALLDKNSSVVYQTKAIIAAMLLRSAGWPQNRSATDQGRRLLWGIGSGPHKAGAFDPYEHFYALIKDVISEGYTQRGAESSVDSHSTAVLDPLESFLSNCPLSLLLNALRQLQDGLVIWIQDSQRKVFSSVDVAAAHMTTEIWNRIIDQLTGLPRKDGALLSFLQPLIVAGFVSPKRAVVNRTIVFWNECFGEQDKLRYPTELAKVLRAARPYVELALPNFPESEVDEGTIELPAFSGPQDQDSQGPPDATFGSRWSGLPQGTMSPVKRTPASHDVSSHLASINTGGTSSASKKSSTVNEPKPKARLRHDDSQVLFAPIESSPMAAADDSQPLTEHQREVRARQDESAQMFPDLSSTPAAKQTPGAKRKTPGKLDFSAGIVQEEATGTPLEMPEGQNEMSGYLGSSPTPRSSDKFRPEHIHVAEDHSGDEPPSSPPRSPRENEDVHLLPGNGPESSFIADSAPPKTGLFARTASKFDELAADSDLPSDTALPAEQLQIEAQAAEQQNNDHEDAQIDATTIVEPTEVSLGDATEQNLPQDDGLEEERVGDSFVEPTTIVEPSVQPSPDGSQVSTRSTRKRKRASTAAESATSKKQKHQSPFRRVFSGIFGASQENDDDVGEEIVVASSQPTDSPTAVRMSQAAEVESQNTQNSVTTSQQPKRGRGRPRKSETPTPAPPTATPLASSTRSKRKASALADADDQDSEDSDTKSTATAKRQRRRARAKKALEDARKSQDENESRPSSRRKATAVVIDKPDADVEITQARMASSDEDESGEESQYAMKQEAATPSQERPKATPKSILGRLKDILGDCKNAIFGSQEEREFDDVLFELRREVHGNARRER